MLTEGEYLAIVDRAQRLTLGDRTVSGDQVLIDMLQLLEDWREWEREVKRALDEPTQNEHDLFHEVQRKEAEIERLEDQANRMAGTLLMCTEEIERLRALILNYCQAATPGELIDATQRLHDEAVRLGHAETG